MEWMEMRKINYSYADYTIHLDLISKTKGIAAAGNYMSNLSPLAKNKYTYGTLLNCCCMGIMEHKALELFEKVDQMGFVSNSLPFTNIMSMYMKLGKPEKVLSLVQDMKRRNISLSTIAYNILMQSYASLNDIVGVERVSEEIEKVDEDKSDWRIYSNLAAVYVKAGLFEKAKIALGKLEEKKMKPGTPHEAYHFVISLYAAIGQLGEVNRIWKTLNSVYPRVTNIGYLVMRQAQPQITRPNIAKKREY
ncbi:Pentatricopeptide repeat [Parasponia andersonii]|uniref:Pentatricopeptide repeat n=1 Tax=Parasponia andersonii TaxID=3476 RepID=A0A2P5CL11_PARAD|nr:Pentatricopeptide repeat [Parasponia andersonii]